MPTLPTVYAILCAGNVSEDNRDGIVFVSSDYDAVFERRAGIDRLTADPHASIKCTHAHPIKAITTARYA